MTYIIPSGDTGGLLQATVPEIDPLIGAAVTDNGRSKQAMRLVSMVIRLIFILP